MAQTNIDMLVDSLWSGEKSSGDTITLPARWQNHKFLGFRLSHYSYGSAIIFAKVFTNDNPVIMFTMSGLASAGTIQSIVMSGTLDVSTNTITLGTQTACNQTSSGNNIFTTANMKITEVFGVG